MHFSSLPTGFMCGLWVALEDITINQGPLHYYPGSHLLPEFDYYEFGISEESVYPENPHQGEQTWDNPRTR
ncbi:phytanoyl-CoA dioxygenase family protein, partial [Acinetobacter baumannii]